LGIEFKLQRPSLDKLKKDRTRRAFLDHNVNTCNLDDGKVRNLRAAFRCALSNYFLVADRIDDKTDFFRKVFVDRAVSLVLPAAPSSDSSHPVYMPVIDRKPAGICFRRGLLSRPIYPKWGAFINGGNTVVGIRKEFFYPSPNGNPITEMDPPWKWAEFIGRRTYRPDSVVDSGVLSTPFGIAIGEFTFADSDKYVAKEKIAFASCRDNAGKDILDWEFYATFIGEEQF